MNKNFKALSASLSAAAVAVLLSACAATESNVGGNAAAASAASSTKYCHKDRYYVSGGEMVCNWTNSAGDACRDNVPSSRIAQSAVTGEPTNTRRCESGQWLVQVTMK